MKQRILFLLLVITGFLQFACKKNSGGGNPVITGVRVIDSTKRDSLFVQSYPGKEIVINGSNLGGATAILFNDTSAYFNPVYNTDTHIIVVIPATAQTAATNPKVPNTIKVITNHGTTSYTFTLVEPPPYITSISFDNTGTEIFINGANFQGISKITFPGGDTALGFTVNKTFDQIAALIPSGSGVTDSLRVFVKYGVASYPFPPPMSIVSVSNENAIAGDSIILTGTNFVVINKVIFPGNIAVSGANLHVQSVSQLSVIVPPGITTTDTLRINGVLGTAGASQLFDSYITHPSPGYLCTFDGGGASDNTGFVNWTGGYAPAPASAYPQATGAVAFLQNGSPMPGSTSPGSQGNSGFVQLNSFPWISNTATPISGYSLKFEINVPQPWSAGALWIMMGGWYAWHDYLARYAPWATATGGKFQTAGWMTVTIPLTAFSTVTGGAITSVPGGYGSPNADNNEWDFKAFPVGGVPATKFSDFTSTSLCFTIVNDQTSPAIAANALNIAIDNVRIVKGQ
jgi:hypothetical protein